MRAAVARVIEGITAVFGKLSPDTQGFVLEMARNLLRRQEKGVEGGYLWWLYSPDYRTDSFLHFGNDFRLDRAKAVGKPFNRNASYRR